MFTVTETQSSSQIVRAHVHTRATPPTARLGGSRVTFVPERLGMPSQVPVTDVAQGVPTEQGTGWKE